MLDLAIRGLVPEEIPAVAGVWRRSRFDAFPEFEARQGHPLEEDVEHLRNVSAREFSGWVTEVDREVFAFRATS
jgi:hypothetical protein